LLTEKITPALDRRLGDPQSLSGHDGEEEETLFLPGIESRSFSP